jgi:hypothetical protein
MHSAYLTPRSELPPDVSVAPDEPDAAPPAESPPQPVASSRAAVSAADAVMSFMPFASWWL